MNRILYSLVTAFAFLLIVSCLLFDRETVPIEQPIEFSHRIHAGEKGMPCLFYHSHARRSTVAGIPRVKTCMGCHRSIARNKPEVQKLEAYQKSGEQVEWRRVYKLEDFVYFSHKRHIRKGIDCSQCHGKVEEMDRVVKVRELTMGWCVNCHRERKAATDCLICHK
ncbi:MAG: cytochrome c3 family protein [Candidatus Glassbacteria bacterium]